MSLGIKFILSLNTTSIPTHLPWSPHPHTFFILFCYSHCCFRGVCIKVGVSSKLADWHPDRNYWRFAFLAPPVPFRQDSKAPNRRFSTAHSAEKGEGRSVCPRCSSLLFCWVRCWWRKCTFLRKWCHRGPVVLLACRHKVLIVRLTLANERSTLHSGPPILLYLPLCCIFMFFPYGCTFCFSLPLWGDNIKGGVLVLTLWFLGCHVLQL